MSEGVPDPTPEPDLADMYDQLKDLPCSVDRIEVSPPELQTRLLLILREFKHAKEANTLDEVARATQQAVECLQELGVFTTVDASLRPGDAGKAQRCNVDVGVREAKLYGITSNALVDGNGQFTANVVGRLRNISGNCEHHSLTLSQGRANIADVETEVTYRLRFPRIFGQPVHAQTSIHQLWQDCQADSSYTERLRGINFDFIGSGGGTKVGYELSWLQLVDVTRRRASREVVRDFGDHVKGAIHVTRVVDRRVPVAGGALHAGVAAKAAFQLAGLTPDPSVLQFVQGRVDCRYARQLSESTMLTVDGATGLMLPILGCRKIRRETMIRERFFLGGVASMRGFAYKGVGPRAPRRAPEAEGGDAANKDAGSDALGGDLFATLRTAVNFLLPQETLRRFGVQGHIFADTGNITPLSGPTPLSQRLDDFWNKWRLSAGMGLKLPVGRVGHIELNFVQTLARYGSDQAKPGFEIGFASDPYHRTPPSAM